MVGLLLIGMQPTLAGLIAAAAGFGLRAAAITHGWKLPGYAR
jgi:uncharacterized membrane protein YeiH